MRGRNLAQNAASDRSGQRSGEDASRLSLVTRHSSELPLGSSVLVNRQFRRGQFSRSLPPNVPGHQNRQQHSGNH